MSAKPLTPEREANMREWAEKYIDKNHYAIGYLEIFATLDATRAELAAAVDALRELAAVVEEGWIDERWTTREELDYGLLTTLNGSIPLQEITAMLTTRRVLASLSDAAKAREA